jgi:sporulation protein YlmC with PRC-barrel domain
MLRLSEVLGRHVLNADGTLAGRLNDLIVELAPRPRVIRLRIHVDRRHEVDIPWSAISSFESANVHLTPAAEPTRAALSHDQLLLARHVLDAQIVDLAGKCLTRVADVELSVEDRSLIVAGVEVGTQPLLRRLGLGLLARRAHSHSLRWTDLHLVSYRGRVVQLAASGIEEAAAPSHSELVERLAPQARRPRFRFRWMRRRAPA